MITAYTPEQLEATQRVLRERMPKEPPLANVSAVMELDSQTFFLFRGRGYLADPVPYRAGLRLFQLNSKLLEAAQADFTADAHYSEYAELMREAVDLISTLARPQRMPRWWYALRCSLHLQPNGFADASEREIGELLGFFLRLRTKSRFSTNAVPFVNRMKSRNRTQSTD